jgi:hypothetical protein
MMLGHIVATGTLVLREIGGTHPGEVAAHGFLSCDAEVNDVQRDSHGRRPLAGQSSAYLNISKTGGRIGSCGCFGFAGAAP